MPMLLSDRWTVDDALDFSPAADALADVLATPLEGAPLTVHLAGPGGSGRTSMMRMTARRLVGRQAFAWFDAARHPGAAGRWTALGAMLLDLLPLVDEDRGSARTGDLHTALTADLAVLAVQDAAPRLQLGMEAFLRGGARAFRQVLQQFLPGGEAGEALLQQTHLHPDDLEAVFEAIHLEQTRLHEETIYRRSTFNDRLALLIAALPATAPTVLFIDHLDRCAPDEQRALLTDLHTHLAVPGVAFVVATRGDHPDAPFDLTVRIPMASPALMRRFILSLPIHWPDLACADVFADALSGTPRAVKRTLNAFLFSCAQAGAAGVSFSPLLLARLFALRHRFPDVYARCHADPTLLVDLEQAVGRGEAVLPPFDRPAHPVLRGLFEGTPFADTPPDARALLLRYIHAGNDGRG